MLFIIIAFIAGIVAGQWIHLSVDPKLVALTSTAFGAVASETADLKGKFIALVNEARMGPLQKAIKREFELIDSVENFKDAIEAQHKDGGANGTPAA